MDAHIIQLAAHALRHQPKLWKRAVREVTHKRDLSANIKRNNTPYLHAALSQALWGTRKHMPLKTRELLDALRKSYERSLNAAVVHDDADTLVLTARLACVLFRLGRLTADVRLARLALSMGCVSTTLHKHVTEWTNNDTAELARSLVDAWHVSEARRQGVFAQTETILRDLSPSRFASITPVGEALVAGLLNFYNKFYQQWAFEHARRVPIEAITLLLDPERFDGGVLMHNVKSLLPRRAMTSANIGALEQALVNERDHGKSGNQRSGSGRSNRLLKHIRHLQALLSMRLSKSEPATNVAQSIAKLTQLYLERSPFDSALKRDTFFDLTLQVSDPYLRTNAYSRYDNMFNFI